MTQRNREVDGKNKKKPLSVKKEAWQAPQKGDFELN